LAKVNRSNGVCILRPRESGIIGFGPFDQKFLKLKIDKHGIALLDFRKAQLAKIDFVMLAILKITTQTLS